MKNALLLPAALIIYFSASSQTWIKPAEAPAYGGEVVKVVGALTDLSLLSENKMGAARLSLGANQGFPITLLIARRDRKQFEKPGKDLVNPYVQVTGRVVMRKGQPYIRLKSPGQLTLLHEAPDLMRHEPR